MGDSRNDDTPDDTQADANVTERRKDFTRRALLRAGWTAPLVTAVNIPSAFAQSPVPPHTDHSDHSDHSDLPHQDHQDHVDAHIDSHTDVHTDVPHADTPHVDTP